MSKEKPDAWMPLYTGDWDSDTADLSCEEDGAYGRLVRSYWRNGPPANDDAILARIVRMDLRAWKKLRPRIERFFQITDGVWRQKRVDAELIRWTEKKRLASEKARDAADARWGKKDAPSNAPSKPKAMLQAMHEQCPSPSSTEVEANKEASTLCGRQDADAHADGATPPCAWSGPESVRQAFSAALGDDWCRKYFDHCRWQDVPDRTVIPPDPVTGRKIIKDGSKILSALGLVMLMEKVA